MLLCGDSDRVIIMSTKKIAFLGIMLAIMLILVVVERALVTVMPPQFGGIGLSNIIIMYLLFFIGKKEAITMAILKSVFNFLIRGPIASLLSLSGGLLSVFVILAFRGIFKDRASFVALSISGAVAHNLGQLVVACLIMQNWRLFYAFFPFLLIAGAIFGTVTGISLKVLMPIFDRIYE